MASEERKKELLEQLADGVLNYDEDKVREAANAVLAEGIDANEAVFDGLVAGMKEAGRLYEIQEYFVPELLMCADALYAGLDILRPHMKSTGEEGKPKGQVVMGVVQGDVHDIGKNLVKIMFEAAGFEVHDLGKDVPLEKFVEEQLRTDSEIVALSAMMTTTMVGMKDIIKAIKEKNPKARIMIGGAPVTDEIADRFGADGYAKDASNALKEAIDMIASLRDM
ncbi:cobalamin-binding protein [Desulfofundulus thermobenzoicus]|uniref:Cobalamin-binding protein n=1 Tax=Desulfofundulus thermobenzoicus TaxID=29376 RepID=A0A6N7IRQ4_9FIRM|nr:corrinoid protein [Desulfofundulus thermobenzoicus]MQL52730.1 cobalamin-binding protein [Desulfofundulus thermobenzoicus]